MASGSLRTGLQVLLWALIAALSYFLYLSISEPYEMIERQKELTDVTRMRMDKVRQVAIFYEARNERFPLTIDSLVLFAKSDSLFSVKRDSILGPSVTLDSLIYSPRTGKKFEYAANDTSRVKTYLLTDPDPNHLGSTDKIGTLLSDVTLLNAASWE